MRQQAAFGQTGISEVAPEQTVVLIGYGTAGVNAAIALRAAGFTGRILAFSKAGEVPYSPILTSYYAAGEKQYEECFPWKKEELTCLNVKVLCETVERLDVDAHIVYTAQGSYPYNKCLIATGADPTLNGFPQVEGYNPLTLRSMDDACKLKARLEEASCEHVLVSGASMVALKMVEACLAHGLKVTMVGMAKHLLNMNALPEAAECFERGLQAMGVSLKLGTVISEVRCVESRLGRQLEVGFADGSLAVFDEICVAHGMRSNLGFIDSDSLEIDRALLVDEYMRTSNPDVYAAGDVAQALELISGKRQVVGIWKNAAVQGACAAYAMAAELAGVKPDVRARYKGSFSSNTIAVGDVLFISAGTIEFGENRRVEVRKTDDLTVVYVYEGVGENASVYPHSKERLVGFNVVCTKREAHSRAYDTGGMLSIRIEKACAR